jgi:glycosyltransferase involved in cell wall biosynthesis
MVSKVEMISVVIPTLNEAGNILETVTTIQKEISYIKEIIIVDGNSTDGTQEIVKDTNFCRLIIEPRRGYGLALLQPVSKRHAVWFSGDITFCARKS